MIYLHQIDPIAVSLGPLKIHWYGIMYLLGFFCAWFLGKKRILAGRFPGVSQDSFSDLLFYGMLGVVLGGRIGYMLFYAFGDLIQNPLVLFKIWDGGMSFHGGFLGVLITTWFWSKKQSKVFFDTVDFLTPLVPLGLGFGRIGNYIGGELWGKFTHANWGVIFPNSPPLYELTHEQLQQQYASGALNAFARHPSQLYQAALEGFILFLIVFLYSKTPYRRYSVSGLFALFYGIFRFLVEFVRVPDNEVYIAWGWLTRGQILTVPIIILGIVLLIMSRHSPMSK